MENTTTSLLFARATIAYLHVVTSGPNPHVEEIAVQMVELVKIFGNITALKRMIALRSASWPLCVTASLAKQEQLEILEHSLGMLLQGEPSSASMDTDVLAVMKDCHRFRENEGSNYSWGWGWAMKEVGTLMLLD